jgi:ABC-type sugar transport system, permease component
MDIRVNKVGLAAYKNRLPPNTGCIREKVEKIAFTILLVVLAVIFILPLVFTVSNSFMSEKEIMSNYSMVMTQTQQTGKIMQYANMKIIPDMVVISQYYTVLLKRIKFIFMFWNSVILVLPIIVGQVVVASMAAYAFAKIEFRWREQLFFIYIITMLMPFQVTLVPNYIVAYRLGLVGSYLSIIFPGIFSTFGVFLLRQFMIHIPDEYSEAARMDGANQLDIFARIVLPMTKAGIAALAILLFIDNWNMVEQPIVFLQDQEKLPLSIYLSRINEGERGIAFAASVIYMAPMLLTFLYGENYLVEGIQLSGIKG